MQKTSKDLHCKNTEFALQFFATKTDKLHCKRKMLHCRFFKNGTCGGGSRPCGGGFWPCGGGSRPKSALQTFNFFAHFISCPSAPFLPVLCAAAGVCAQGRRWARADFFTWVWSVEAAATECLPAVPSEHNRRINPVAKQTPSQVSARKKSIAI